MGWFMLRGMVSELSWFGVGRFGVMFVVMWWVGFGMGWFRLRGVVGELSWFGVGRFGVGFVVMWFEVVFV